MQWVPGTHFWQAGYEPRSCGSSSCAPVVSVGVQPAWDGAAHSFCGRSRKWCFCSAGESKLLLGFHLLANESFVCKCVFAILWALTVCHFQENIFHKWGWSFMYGTWKIPLIFFSVEHVVSLMVSVLDYKSWKGTFMWLSSRQIILLHLLISVKVLEHLI